MFRRHKSKAGDPSKALMTLPVAHATTDRRRGCPIPVLREGVCPGLRGHGAEPLPACRSTWSAGAALWL